VNRAPEVAHAIEDVVRDEDAGPYDIADLDDVFNDPDDDELTFSFDTEDDNLGIALDQQTHVLSMDPVRDYWVDNVMVTVTADDHQGNRQAVARVLAQNQAQPLFDFTSRDVRSVRSGSQWLPQRDDTADDLFTVIINPVNDAPVWVEYPQERITVDEGARVQFDLIAEDVDDEALNLTVEDLPNGAVVEPTGGQSWRLTWDTPAGSAGDYAIRFIVADGARETDEITVDITVLHVNHAPEVVNPIADVVREEDAGQYDIADLDEVFRDRDGDEMSFSFACDDENLQVALDQQTHVLSLDPIANYWVDDVMVTVTADDQQGGRRVLAAAVAQRQAPIARDNTRRDVRNVRNGAQALPQRDETTDDVFTITISAFNDEPFWIDPPQAVQVDEGDMVQFTLNADDFDFLFNGQEGLTLTMLDDAGTAGRGAQWAADNNNKRGTYTWQTDFRDAGVYRPVFRVADRARANADVTVTITVNDVPQDPYITMPSEEDVYDRQVAEGQDLLIEFIAEDDDNNPDELTWAITPVDLPGGHQFNDMGDGTAEFTWTPGPLAARQNPYEPIFTVTDPDNHTDRITVRITVTDVNHAPVIQQPSAQDQWATDATEGQELRFHVEATDVDLDDLQYTADWGAMPGNPQFAAAGNGRDFVWTPPFAAGHNEPSYDVVFDVSDTIRTTPAPTG